MIFNIQRWSLHDGAGIRTTVFFKGCPLHCLWCSNPESQRFGRELFFREQNCVGCGRCVEACAARANVLRDARARLDRSLCRADGACADACPQQGREIAGLSLTAGEIVAEIARDAVFYRASGGGVTFSGGEPFAQPGLLRELAEQCQDLGVPAAVETCGLFALDEAEDILESIDHVFIDLKHADDAAHHELTGASNRVILANIAAINAMRKEMTIRLPLVAGLTDTDANILGAAAICKGLPHPFSLELMPYHDWGAGKYDALGRSPGQGLAAPDAGRLAAILDMFRKLGLQARCAKIPAPEA